MRTSDRDTWQLREDEEGLWMTRPLAGDWALSHLVVLQGGRPVIGETRVHPATHGGIPLGGLDSALLRLVTVRGAADAAAGYLPRESPLPDYRDLAALSAGAGRQGETRRWNLVITAGAYAQAVADGSRHPNRDVSDSLGIPVTAVRDRIHKARTADPPILTGGGKQGTVGKPELTPAAVDVLHERFRRLMAEAGYPLSPQADLRVRRFDTLLGALVQEAGRRLPGFWTMTLDDLGERAPAAFPPDAPDTPGGDVETTGGAVDPVGPWDSDP